MGYYMSSHKADFHIEEYNIPAVLALLNGDENCHDHADTIEDAFRLRGYDVASNDEGDITGIWFDNGRLMDDYDMFQAIAPHVCPGSYLIMRGEDGHFWKWLFTDGKCVEIGGTLVFDHVYDVGYELVLTRINTYADMDWSQTTTHRFLNLQTAFRHMLNCYQDADLVEPLMFHSGDAHHATQIGYRFWYAPLRLSSAPNGDEIRATIRRITKSSPIEESLLPRLPTLERN